ncbi:MAG: DUF1858 domain-containing protein [Anaerolineae bacterium]|nr:DUF1858 domain-containing protein [Anaerolineae bacterium]
MIDLPLTANTFIASTVDYHRKLAEVFNSHGMACVGCVFSRFHTLAEAAEIYKLEMPLLLSELAAAYASIAEQDTKSGQ